MYNMKRMEITWSWYGCENVITIILIGGKG